MTTQTIEIEVLTILQLVALYNEHAEKPVKKFSDRATAIKRVTALIETINAAKQEIETMDTTIETTQEVEQVEQVETTHEVETLPEITDLEHLVLLGVAESDYQNGGDPEDERMVWSFSVTNYLSSKKAAGALVASLVKKGLLHYSAPQGEEDEAVGFTKLGAAVYRAKVEKAPMPVNAKPKRERKAKVEQVATFATWFDSLFQQVETKAPKAKREKKAKAEKPAREPSKAQIMFNMIQQEGGALKSELLAICGWKGCAVSLGRACEKAGLTFVKTKLESGDWTYSAVAKA